MDSFELNKIIGAILGTLLFVMGVGFIAEAIYAPIEGVGQGYVLPEPEGGEAAGDGGEPEVPAEPLGVLLASASAENGAAASRKCQGCHTFEQGGANKQGPNLYDAVERLIGSHDGFAYSDAFNALREEGRTWTYDELNGFLINPREHIPGTKMNFPGVRTAEERADILAYLQTLSASPKPFPEPEAAEPPPANIPEGEGEVVENQEAPQPVDAINTPTETMTESPVGTSTGSGPGGEPNPSQPGEPGAPTSNTPAGENDPQAATSNNNAGATEADADQTNDINASGAPGGDEPVPPNTEIQSGGTPTPMGTLSPWVTAPLDQ